MKKNIWIGLGVGILVGLILMTVVLFNKLGILDVIEQMTIIAKEEDSGHYFNQSKVSYIDRVIEKSYIGQLPTEEEGIESIYRGYVYGVEDEGTMYLSPEEYAKESAADQGQNLGIGIEFAWGISEQYLIVTDVLEDSPADQAGIVIGDCITAIDQIPAMMSNNVILYEKLGYVGEDPVVYSIVANDGTPKGDIPLVAQIAEFPLIESEKLESGLGYIKINRMAKGVYQAIEKQLQSFEEQKITQLVLDVRGTTGNALDEVTALAALFIDEGDLFKIQGKDESQKTIHVEGQNNPIELAILTNQFTSGSIEGFVASMITNERAIVVGEPTKGQGSIQELIDLGDGSGMYITTARMYSMEGQSLIEDGVEPTILQHTPATDTLEVVTKGYLPHEKDTLMQTAIDALKQ